MTFKNKMRQLKKFPIKVNIFPIYVLCILSRIQTVNMDSIIKAVLVLFCFFVLNLPIQIHKQPQIINGTI